ncbi:MAG: exosortase T [Pseudomonadota bacterium]
MQSIPSNHKTVAAGVLIGAGVCLLALDPMLWLVRSWFNPGYDSIGAAVALLTIAMFGWSWSSALLAGPARISTPMLWLLCLSAVIRLVAQVLDINVLGALLLGVDVYALARLARLQDRVRRIEPLWLALLFCLCLPIEVILQRLVGFPLQMLTAQLTCATLGALISNTSCSGITLWLNGLEVVIDLPCAGSRLLMLCALVLGVAAALKGPTLGAMLARLPLWFAIALLGNTLRVTLLALGLAYTPALNLMAEPGHSLLGLCVLSICTVLIWKWLPPRPVRAIEEFLPAATRGRPLGFLFALPFFLFAATVGSIQPRPLDTSASLPTPEPAMVAAGFSMRTERLSAIERRYLATYGGTAQKYSYGPFGLTLASTKSPLRHLHDPLRCFAAAGFHTQFERLLPKMRSARYRAEHPELGAFAVFVSYRSDSGQLAMSIGEAVWLWLQNPGSRWTMIQRVIPDEMAAPEVETWHAAIRRRFDLDEVVAG